MNKSPYSVTKSLWFGQLRVYKSIVPDSWLIKPLTSNRTSIETGYMRFLITQIFVLTLAGSNIRLLCRVILISLVSLATTPSTASTNSNTPVAQLYLQYCSVCHGEKGDAKTHAKQGLRPPPLDFTANGVQSWLSRERMIDVVTNGKPGTAMVGWKTQLTASQINMLVDYIRDNFMSPVSAVSATSVTTDNPAGKKVYAETCSVCHGEDGAGALWGKTSLNPQPVNFTDPGATKYLTRERMIASVKNGRAGTAMTAFSSQLSDSQIAAVVDYIQAAFFKSKEKGPGHKQQASERAASTVGMAVIHGQVEPIDNSYRSVITHKPSQSMTSNLSGDAATGKAYYLQNCTACHGINGDGNGPRAYFIFPKPRNFHHPDFQQHLTRLQLFNAIKNGVLGREMPAWGKVLSDQQIMDVTEYVFQAFITTQGNETANHDLP